MESTFEKLDSASAPHLAEAFPGFTDGFVRVKPSNLLISSGFEEQCRPIKDLLLRSDDIWLLSFPKSGTTWTQEMVWLIANNFDYEGAKTFLRMRFPFLEETALVPKSWNSLYEGAACEDFNVKSNDVVLSLEKLKDFPSPRFVKSHLPLTCLPDGLLETCKTIYVARNPKDVAISWYFHHHLDPIMETPSTLEEFLEFFIKDEVLYAPYWGNILEAWQRRNHPNMLFIFYEDLKEDLPGQIRKVSQFLGKIITEEQISRLESHLNFDNFKNNPAVNCEELQSLGLFRKEGNFIRKGQSGGWKKHFNDEINKKFNEWIKVNLKNTGLTFKNVD